MAQNIKRIFESLDKHSPFPINYSFRMSKAEIELFDKIIKPSKGYLEFGCGGSTFHILLKTKAIVYSVDSDMRWINKLREYSFIRFMEKRRLKFLFVDIGPVREWGKPVNYAHKNLFPNYSAQVFNLICKEAIDLVLIDGRFRVACTLKTILEFSNNNKLKIVFHDFCSRSEYYPVLNYVDEIDRAETLSVFNIKENINMDFVQKDYDVYKHIPA